MICTQAEEWIERLIDGDARIPDEVEKHLEDCAHCREYKADLEQIAQTLSSWDIPALPPRLADEVMGYIRKREKQRVERWLIPGQTFFRMVAKTLDAYRPTIQVPIWLRREAWPTALATLAVVWGLLIAPQVEAGRGEEILRSPIVTEVNKVADTLRSQGEKLADSITSLAAGWIGDGTGDAGNTENQTNGRP